MLICYVNRAGARLNIHKARPYYREEIGEQRDRKHSRKNPIWYFLGRGFGSKVDRRCPLSNRSLLGEQVFGLHNMFTHKCSFKTQKRGRTRPLFIFFRSMFDQI